MTDKPALSLHDAIGSRCAPPLVWGEATLDSLHDAIGSRCAPPLVWGEATLDFVQRFSEAVRIDFDRGIRLDFVERYVLGVVAVAEGATPIGVPDWSDLTDAEQEECERLVAGWLVGSVEIVR